MMARLVTYASFSGTQGVGRSPRPACYAVYRAELHEGWGDCSPACHRQEGLAWPHVDLMHGERLAVLTPTDPKWSRVGVARLYASEDAPAFDFGREDD